MDLDAEELADEVIHPVVSHYYGAVGRIENREVEHGAEEIMVAAEVPYPLLELDAPLDVVLFSRIASVEIEGQLVVAVVFKPEDAGKYQVKFLQVAKIRAFVFVYFHGHLVFHAKGVMPQQVFHLYKVDQILKQGLLKGKLYFFQDIILIAGKKLF